MSDSDIPGGRMESRPVHFIWLLDCSGSMGVQGKIDALNFAVREAIPEMQSAARSNPSASLLLRAITFSSGAQWHVQHPTDIHSFTWTNVGINGVTDMGAAFRLAATELDSPPMPQRALRPVLALVSDGQPTDDWRAGLKALDQTPWGSRAVRTAIAIGNDADRDVLKEFLANPEQEPLDARNPRQLAAAIRWASTNAVMQASAPRLGTAPTVPAMAVGFTAPDDEDVW